MSALCQKRTFCAEKCTPLFDHLVGCLQEGFRDSEAKGFSGLEIDNQHVLGRELHRQVTWLRALENEIDIRCRLPILIAQIHAIRNKAAIPRDNRVRVNRRKLIPCRQSDYEIAMQ